MTTERISIGQALRALKRPSTPEPAPVDPPTTGRAGRPRTAPAARVPQRLDGIGQIPMFAGRKERVSVMETAQGGREGSVRFTMPDGSIVQGESIDVVPPALLQVHRKGRPPTWGAEAMIAELTKFNVRFELAPDRSLVAVAADRRFGIAPEIMAAIRVAAALIRGHLAGEPLPCVWCGAPAVTVLVLGQGACAQHATEVPR